MNLLIATLYIHYHGESIHIMKIKCAYSGLELQVTHFPAFLNHQECCHPIFYIPQKKLIQYLRKWGNGELTAQDSYLLYLALLNSTDLIDFRTHAVYIPATTEKIIANNMEHLARIISYTNTIIHPAFSMPRIVIDPNTANLSDSPIWIQDWNQCYVDFCNGYIKQIESEKIKKREALLHNFIKNASRPIAHYAKILADWAAEAGEFPLFPITIDGKSIRICDYWKQIIMRCCKAESIFSIPSNDLAELIEHCEINIEHGSIYAHSLMELLRAGATRQQNYLGLGDLDLSLTTYRIIDAETSIEDASKMAMIDSAPKEKPTENQYPSKLAYLRARLKYEMAQEYYKQLELATAISTHTNTEIVLTDDGKEL